MHRGAHKVFSQVEEWAYALARDEDGVVTEIGALAEMLGFAPASLWGLSKSARLVQRLGNTLGKLIFKDLMKFA